MVGEANAARVGLPAPARSRRSRCVDASWGANYIQLKPMNMLTTPLPGLPELNERSREIFRHIVAAYVSSGEPVGSRTISQRLGMSLSPATIRNVMSDLEDAGLLYAPHTS